MNGSVAFSHFRGGVIFAMDLYIYGQIYNHQPAVISVVDPAPNQKYKRIVSLTCNIQNKY